MKHKHGFTLTEILLAVMVVALIGVALASLTTAASREGGSGRTRTVLRNSLSRAVSQLRQDVQDSSQVLYGGPGAIGSVSANTFVPLLVLAQNMGLDGQSFNADSVSYVTYCFKIPTLITTNAGGTAIVPSGAIDGGIIYRKASDTIARAADGSLDMSNVCTGMTEPFLNHVKFIPTNYPVPFFQVDAFNALRIRLILELPSNPVVNDVTEEILYLPIGQ